MKNLIKKIKSENGIAYYCVIPVAEKDDHMEEPVCSTLGREALIGITAVAESYVICADRCVLSKEDLKNYHILFRKIPRDRYLLPLDVREVVESMYPLNEVREWEESKERQKSFWDGYETFLSGICIAPL